MMLAHQNSGAEEVHEPEMFAISSFAAKFAESCLEYFTYIESLNHKTIQRCWHHEYSHFMDDKLRSQKIR